MKATLREYFHALNVLDMEEDVTVDGTDACIAVVPPVKLTQKGEETFGKMLDNKDLFVDVEKDGHCIMSDNQNDYDMAEEDKGTLFDVCRFIYALAGYCSASDYDEWFTGDDAKEV